MILAPKFSLGDVVGTPGALQAIEESGQTPSFFLDRHVRGDYGDLDQHDLLQNEEALIHGDRLMSVYQTLKNVRIWIITESDRSVTTLLLPDDY